MSGDDRTQEAEFALSFKAGRLLVASHRAPIVRGRAHARRKITVVDAVTGTPLRVTDDVEIAKGVLALAKIELAVEGARPEYVFCQRCGDPIKVIPKGKPPAKCRLGCAIDAKAAAEQRRSLAMSIIDQAVAAAAARDNMRYLQAIGRAAEARFSDGLIDQIKDLWPNVLRKRLTP